ncbi:MAG TPA: DNA-directed RNA polymerase subunit omega [Thermoanaerobaculia bacterium]|nr:DNA-directed RNA polymerase subunit omega [Thermoanaerobaculia bacterium]
MDGKQPPVIDSKFRLVLLAATRAEQIMRGARPKVEAGKKKSVRVAMDEIAHKLVDWGYGPPPQEEPPAEEAKSEEEPVASGVH